MSRVGRKPVPVPKGVNVTIAGRNVAVKGPKGELKRELPTGVSLKVEAGQIQVSRADDSRENRSKHGLTRALVANMVTGVTTGFERQLEINGVGYRAEVSGQKLTFALGYSHPIVYEMPKGIGAKVDKQILVLTGSDRELLGEVAAKIRGFRPPEPYKGKGVKYVEETIRRKVGKTGSKLMGKTKVEARDKRKHSIRKRVNGTAERPRMSVFRSLKHIYVQVVDDVAHQTLAAVSDLDEQVKASLAGPDPKKKKDRAKLVGAAIAKRCLEKGIAQVVFDRNGFIYHGRVSALADGAREAGLKF